MDGLRDASQGVRRALAYYYFDDRRLMELEWRRIVAVSGLAEELVPVVTAEDIILARLRWYRQGGDISAQQWRDIVGVLRGDAGLPEGEYNERWAVSLGLLNSCHEAEAAW
ncbi:MAG: hypothetical protein HXY18_08465 [Bryobacteraceae bacterium]|nr:hypothetical protein [Bryobacteraceae bacterium]